MGVVCMWTCKCGTQGGQLELKAVVSHPERVLRTELRSAKRPVSAPNCWVALQPLNLFLVPVSRKSFLLTWFPPLPPSLPTSLFLFWLFYKEVCIAKNLKWVNSRRNPINIHRSLLGNHGCHSGSLILWLAKEYWILWLIFLRCFHIGGIWLFIYKLCKRNFDLEGGKETRALIDICWLS